MNNNKPLVLVEYFGGWWEPMPNKWHTGGRDWREDYPGRIPLLGQYNSQSTMDAEIVAASSHGVDAFNILWYPDTGATPEPTYLNSSLEHFMHSPESHRMKFSIEYCNHEPFDVTEEKQWRAICDYFTDCMKHPSYLRAGDKAYFKVHGLYHFRRQMGGDLSKMRKFIDILRDMAREKGVGELIVSTGVMPDEHKLGRGYFEEYAGIFDAYATYMDLPVGLDMNVVHPYSLLLDKAEQGWEGYGRLGLNYIPYLPAGWDPRPWKDPRPSYAFPDRDQWQSALQSIAESFEKYPSLGIPLADGTVLPAFTIYAWNEYGEGGIVAPTNGEGWMKLEEIAAFKGLKK